MMVFVIVMHILYQNAFSHTFDGLFIRLCHCYLLILLEIDNIEIVVGIMMLVKEWMNDVNEFLRFFIFIK